MVLNLCLRTDALGAVPGCRPLALALALAMLTLVVSAGSALAATITVTSSADTGAGTLRQAILAANSGDVINFAPSLAGGQTITLTTGELVRVL